ncbi:Hpt domain-containing protein [Fluviispira vulneris]|uniref:Hpt domain-containing protein n=1 Tax=Fluviispira vulneris TaxID=2763012 RepID=UPI001646C3F6|nr:Hpt domain-containing protein [Fluviispira vulneris]
MIDREKLKKYEELQINGKPDVVIEIIESFLQTSKKIIKSLFFCLQNSDYKGASDNSHKLKSSAHAIGATVLGDLCAKIESLNEENKIDDIKIFSELLKNEYKNACNELNDIKKSRGVKNI